MKSFAIAPRPRLRGGRRLGLHLRDGMRVGLYGGSFDPPHAGHAFAARRALAALRLDRLVWLVSPGNPLKPGAASPAAARLRAAWRRAGQGRMAVSDVESRLGTRFTIDTARLLRARWRSVHFVWVMGADSLAQLHRWRGWADLFHTLPIAVVNRPGYDLLALNSPAARRFAFARRRQREAARLAFATPPAWIFLIAPRRGESSTALRNQGLTSMVPDMLASPAATQPGEPR